jgi:hypothetical protein
MVVTAAHLNNVLDIRTEWSFGKYFHITGAFEAELAVVVFPADESYTS